MKNTLLVSLIMINSAFCATKPGLSDELYESLKKTAHKVHYENLMYDGENVWDVYEAMKATAHKPDYSAKVIAIDHKGETITIETKEAKKKRVAKEKAAKEKAAKKKADKK